MEQEPQNIPKKTSFLKELLNFALILIFIVLPIRLFVAQPFVVVGSSMEPTFIDGDYLIVDELTYRLSQPKRGEVVVFDYGELVEDTGGVKNPSKFFIKRIIGLPGETVDIKNQVVTIFNTAHPEGFVLDEPYISEPPLGTIHTTLTDDQYFVMGDHRGVSFDSRAWGPLPRKELTGRVLLRLFPFQKIGAFPGSYSGDYINEQKN